MHFNRRMMRRQKKVVLFSVGFLILVVVYIVLFVEDHTINEDHFHPLSERCVSTASKRLVDEVVCAHSIFYSGLYYSTL